MTVLIAVADDAVADAVARSVSARGLAWERARTVHEAMDLLWKHCPGFVLVVLDAASLGAVSHVATVAAAMRPPVPAVFVDPGDSAAAPSSGTARRRPGIRAAIDRAIGTALAPCCA